MSRLIEVGLASPSAAMEAFLEPHRPWIESVTGCSHSETLTFESEFPFSHLVLEELLAGTALDRQCLGAAGILRRLVTRWELPPGGSPRVVLFPSRDRRARVTGHSFAWDPHWRESPIAVWLRDLNHGLVTAEIPYVSCVEKGSLCSRQWTVVNRREAAACLNLLLQVQPPRRLKVIGGRDIPLAEEGYDWNPVVLDPALNLMVRNDYHSFFEREAWFVERRLPYRRGYLLYGPPGNGKTTVARIMACHPLVSPFSIDFSSEGLPNDALSDLFQAAADRAPSLIILEDLDRVFGTGADGANRTQITLQHLLNCLDGLGSQNGGIVVATANDPARLDAAVLKRPGRFDRLVPFPCPSARSRLEYLLRLTERSIPDEKLGAAVAESDRLSFAQIREAYITAGQLAYQRTGDVLLEDVLAGIYQVRGEAAGVTARADGRAVGFGTGRPDDGHWEGSPVRKRS